MGEGTSYNSLTFRLFRDYYTDSSSLVAGVASLLGTAGASDLYNYNSTAREADVESIRCDWIQVGDDLREVMDTYASSGAQPGASRS